MANETNHEIAALQAEVERLTTALLQIQAVAPFKPPNALTIDDWIQVQREMRGIAVVALGGGP
jgi:hypothetical protein